MNFEFQMCSRAGVREFLIENLDSRIENHQGCYSRRTRLLLGLFVVGLKASRKSFA
jgi:hypothetical protein